MSADVNTDAENNLVRETLFWCFSRCFSLVFPTVLRLFSDCFLLPFLFFFRAVFLPLFHLFFLLFPGCVLVVFRLCFLPFSDCVLVVFRLCFRCFLAVFSLFSDCSRSFPSVFLLISDCLAAASCLIWRSVSVLRSDQRLSSARCCNTPERLKMSSPWRRYTYFTFLTCLSTCLDCWTQKS